MALQVTQIGDIVQTTLNELGRLKFTDIASDLRRHIALKRLLKTNKVAFGGGKAIQWDLITDNNGSARFNGLYDSDNVNVRDVMIQGSIDWRHFTFNFAFDNIETLVNSGPAQIVELIKTRRIGAFASAVELLEARFWQLPAAGDTLNPHGVPYWIVKSATAATTANNNGFNGGAPSGYTTVAGISPTDYPRWRNYADAYTEVSKVDLVRKLRRAMVMTNFELVVDEIPDFNTGDDYGMYTTYDVVSGMEELLESQNENLGTDIASMDGKVTFRRVPMTDVPVLQADTTNPVYGINWGEFKTAGLKGRWLKETHLPIQPGQRNVSATHYDTSANFFTRNRRRHFVISNGTTLP
jgi:hypothetical protein